MRCWSTQGSCIKGWGYCESVASLVLFSVSAICNDLNHSQKHGKVRETYLTSDVAVACFFVGKKGIVFYDAMNLSFQSSNCYVNEILFLFILMVSLSFQLGNGIGETLIICDKNLSCSSFPIIFRKILTISAKMTFL